MNAIPSNRLQRPIKGDVERMPVGGEWLYVAPRGHGDGAVDF